MFSTVRGLEWDNFTAVSLAWLHDSALPAMTERRTLGSDILITVFVLVSTQVRVIISTCIVVFITINIIVTP